MAAPRVPLVAGNWKMNPTSRAAAILLAPRCARRHRRPAGAHRRLPAVVFLEAVATAVGGGTTEPGGIGIGAQTMHAEESGAFTGEISPLMLAGLAQYVILGHSERRQYDNETDAAVAAKVASAVAHGLVPIAAIGELAEERRAGETAAVIERQLRAAISQLDRLAGSGLVIAYEPVWAIGTGDAATGDDAQAVAAQIRAILARGGSGRRATRCRSCTAAAARPRTRPSSSPCQTSTARWSAARRWTRSASPAIVRAAAELRG